MIKTAAANLYLLKFLIHYHSISLLFQSLGKPLGLLLEKLKKSIALYTPQAHGTPAGSGQ